MNENFWEGFQKEAVSDEWALRYANSGIDSRLKRGDITRAQADRMLHKVKWLPKFTHGDAYNHTLKQEASFDDLGPHDPRIKSKERRGQRLHVVEDANDFGPKKTKVVLKKQPLPVLQGTLPASKSTLKLFKGHKGKIGISAALLAAGGAAAAYRSRDKTKS